MTALVQQLTDLVVPPPSLAGLVIVVSAASEAIVIVGAVIPGTSIVTKHMSRWREGKTASRRSLEHDA